MGFRTGFIIIFINDRYFFMNLNWFLRRSLDPDPPAARYDRGDPRDPSLTAVLFFHWFGLVDANVTVLHNSKPKDPTGIPAGIQASQNVRTPYN